MTWRVREQPTLSSFCSMTMRFRVAIYQLKYTSQNRIQISEGGFLCGNCGGFFLVSSTKVSRACVRE